MHRNWVADLLTCFRSVIIGEVVEGADAIIAWNPFIRERYIHAWVAEEKVPDVKADVSFRALDLAMFFPVKAEKNDKFIVIHMSSITVVIKRAISAVRL